MDPLVKFQLLLGEELVPASHVSVSQSVVGTSQVRFQPNGLQVFEDRVLELLLVGVEVAELQMCLFDSGVESDGLL